MTGREAMALPSTPDKKPSIADFDSIIRIKVGHTAGNSEVFEIHKGVLKFYSGYFRTAIENVERGRFLEAQENMITLPEEEPVTFKLFQGWVYTRELPKDERNDLVKLWGFADRRVVPLLQNEAINAIQEGNYRVMKELSPLTVYRTAGAGSALRRFTICSHGACVNNDQGINVWPEEFKDDLLKYMLEKRPKFIPDEFEKSDMCEWHVHEEGVRCKE